MVEHETFNLGVEGSSPSGLTKNSRGELDRSVKSASSDRTLTGQDHQHDTTDEAGRRERPRFFRARKSRKREKTTQAGAQWTRRPRNPPPLAGTSRRPRSGPCQDAEELLHQLGTGQDAEELLRQLGTGGPSIAADQAIPKTHPQRHPARQAFPRGRHQPKTTYRKHLFSARHTGIIPPATGGSEHGWQGKAGGALSPRLD